MSTRVLIAGVGNIFFGDDGFGVEVARRLADRSWPPAIAARDFGIGGIHLAFELLAPLDVVLIADAVSRGGEPGTLYIIEPELELDQVVAGSGHGMNLPAVFSQVQLMGGDMPPVILVGCEPGSLDEGIGLTPPVAAAVDLAVERIEALALSRLEPETTDKEQEYEVTEHLR